jgi:hypothetical protein
VHAIMREKSATTAKIREISARKLTGFSAP